MKLALGLSLLLLFAGGVWSEPLTLHCECIKKFDRNILNGKSDDLGCDSSSSPSHPFGTSSDPSTQITIDPDNKKWFIFNKWYDMTEVTDSEYYLFIRMDYINDEGEEIGWTNTLKLNRYSLIFNHRYTRRWMKVYEFGSTFQCNVGKRKL